MKLIPGVGIALERMFESNHLRLPFVVVHDIVTTSCLISHVLKRLPSATDVTLAVSCHGTLFVSSSLLTDECRLFLAITLCKSVSVHPHWYVYLQL